MAPDRHRVATCRPPSHPWLACLLAVLLPGAAPGFELSGFVGAEARLFTGSPTHPGQARNAYSLLAQPELYAAWDDERQSFALVPFARLDSADDERSHFDLREALYQRAERDWELRLGIGRVFWGVTESVHLVDVVNQTDLVEDIDGEEKLGQPMANLALVRDWGTVDLFVLPMFRERTFPGRRGRLRTEPAVDTGQPRYESAREQFRTDLAVRWSHSFGPFDAGLAHFYGTSRDPLLLSGRDAAGRAALIPYYEVMHQTGLDLQVTLDAWLLKLEAIRGWTEGGGTFHALAAGFEYTLVGALGTAADLGILAEYLHDDRGERSPYPFENDVFVGLRLTLNDAPSTEALLGVIQDLDGDATVLSLEARRRLGERWRIDLEARGWSGVAVRDTQFSLRNDDYVQISLRRFF